MSKESESTLAEPLETSDVAGQVGNRQRFLDACHCRNEGRPPIWLMRQAGRSLPEYRALKEKYSFLEIVQTPDLATEATLQPIRRFGFDAAVLFSDILIACEAMGQSYRFREGGGIEMDFVLKSAEDVERLETGAVRERLEYVPTALRQLRGELGDKTALLGFAGAPWTLANFMMEGGSSKSYTRCKDLFYADRGLFDQLMEKLTVTVTELLQTQIEAGVDAVQIFDSHGGHLAANAFESASGQWITRIIEGLRAQVPVIVFAKGANGVWDQLVKTGANALSVDWTMNLAEVVGKLPSGIAVQGNLDPSLLNTTPTTITAEAKRILEEMRDCKGHIFNLGHGVPPTAKLENLEALATAVREFR